MGYDREKYKPGYKGKFVISDHDAIRAGKHWDFRIQMPLIDGGTTYRSFVNKKRQIPTENMMVYMPETEDHSPREAFFEGTIPEGEYGAGETRIYDHGNYELLDVEGDKKYVIDFHGKKLKGVYALVKYKNGFLWVKVKNKKASVIDYPRPTMSAYVWDIEKDPPELRPAIRKAILDNFYKSCKKAGLKNLEWLTGLYIAGSITGYTYREDADIDIDITYDSVKLKEASDEFKSFSGKMLTKKLQRIFDDVNKTRVLNTPHTYSFMVLEEKDEPISDGVFDLMTNRWIKGPVKIPINFDPDRELLRARQIAISIGRYLDTLVGRIMQTLKDLEVIEQYIKFHNRVDYKRVCIKNRLKELCEELNAWHEYIRSLPRKAVKTECPIYISRPVPEIGPNWELNNIVFKYLSRYGYSYPVHLILDKLKNSPYLPLIKSLIPD